MRRFLLVLTVLLAGCGSDEAQDSGGPAEAVQLVAKEYSFDPQSLTVDKTGKVTFRVKNEGGTAHALEVEGKGVEEETESIEPGESGELTVQLAAGEYEFYCPIGNHREMGMEGTLVVGGGATTTEQTQTQDSGYGG
jgi:uncharacterized cupredoxin-like copper-binding protein